jgi:iron-sulfur cluster assembly accessory protein
MILNQRFCCRASVSSFIIANASSISKFDMDHAQAADDVTIRRYGATVLIDQTSVGYLAGSEIDFVDDLISASFRINNPQAMASCGCGTSFSLRRTTADA